MTVERTGLAAGLPLDASTLEAEIAVALSKAPSEIGLAETISDVGDIRRVRRRHLIAAVLDAVFKAEIPCSDPELLSELSAARRDFRHDTDRLDNSIRAELCLAPISKASADVRVPIKADRKLLIKALAAIDLGKDHANPLYKTLRSRIDLLAGIIGYTPKTLDTYKTQMETSITAIGLKESEAKSEFSNDECEYFLRLVERTAKLASGAGSGMDLMLPAIKGLREARVPKPGSKFRDADTLPSKEQD